MNRKRSFKFISLVLAVLLCMEVLSSGLVIFAGSFSADYSAEAELPTIGEVAVETKQPSLLRLSADSESDNSEAAGTKDSSDETAKGSGDDATKGNTPPADDAGKTNAGAGDAGDKDSGTADGGATDKDKETASDTGDDGAVEKEKEGTTEGGGDTQSEADKAAADKAAADKAAADKAAADKAAADKAAADKAAADKAEAEKPAANPIAEYVVNIDDPYLKATLGDSGAELKSLFKVTYTKDDGSVVTVKSGDKVPKGTALKIEATPEFGPVTVTVNETKHQTAAGMSITTTIDHTVDGPVNISVGVEITPFASISYSGGGLMEATVSSQAGLNNLLSKDNGAISGWTTATTEPTGTVFKAGGITKTYTYNCTRTDAGGSTSTETHTIAVDYYYDNFKVNLSGTDVTLNLADLGGRSIEFTGTGTVFLSGSLSDRAVTGTSKAPAGSYSHNVQTNVDIQPVAADCYTTSGQSVNQTITIGDGVILSTDSVVHTSGTGSATSKALFNISKGTISGAGTGAHRLVLTNPATAHQSLRATASANFKVTLGESGGEPTFKGFGLELSGAGVLTNALTNLDFQSTPNTLSHPTSHTGGNNVGWAGGAPGNAVINLTNIGTASYATLAGGAITITGGTHTDSTVGGISGLSLTVTGGAVVKATTGTSITGAVSVSGASTLDATGQTINGGSISIAVGSASKAVNYNATAGNIDFYGEINNIAAGSAGTITGYVQATGVVTFNANNANITVSGDNGTNSIQGSSVNVIRKKVTVNLTTGKNVAATNGNVSVADGCELNATGKDVTASMSVLIGTGGAAANLKAANVYAGSNVTIAKGSIAYVTGNVSAVNKITIAGTLHNGSSVKIANLDANYIEISGAGAVLATNAYGRLTVSGTATGAIDNVYGMGYLNLSNANYTYINVFGGGVDTSPSGCVIDHSHINDTVTSASDGTVGSAVGSATVDSPASHAYPGKVYVAISAGTISGMFYGGGHKVAPSTVTTTISGSPGSPLFGTGLGTLDIYGGSLDAGTGGLATLTVVGTPKLGQNIYGGSHGKNTDVATHSTKVVIGTTVEFAGTPVGKNVYGGGFADAKESTVTNSSTVEITNSKDDAGSEHIENVFGGGFSKTGNDASVGSTAVTVSGDSLVGNDVFGGGTGDLANAGSTLVTLNSATIGNDVYGGGLPNAGKTANVTGLSEVAYENMRNTVYGNLVAGGKAVAGAGTSATAVSTALNINSPGTGSLVVMGFVVGGGHALAGNTDASVGRTVTNKVEVLFVLKDFIAGGFAEGDDSKAAVTGAITTTANLKVGNTGAGSYIGGGYALGKKAVATSGSTVSTTISDGNNTIEADFVGGGKSEGGATDTTTDDLANADVTGAITNTITNLTLTGQYIGAGHAVNMFDTATSRGAVETTVNNVSVGGQFVGGGFAAAENTDASVAGAITTASTGLKVGTAGAGSYIGGGYALGKKAVATSGSTVSTTISDGNNTIEADFVGGGKSEGGATDTTTANANVDGAITNTITNLTLTGQYIGAGHAVKAFDTATSGGTVGTTVNNVSVGGQFVGGGFAAAESTDASVAGAITTTTATAATAGLKVGTGTAGGSYIGGGYALGKKAKATSGDDVSTTISGAGNTIETDFVGGGKSEGGATTATTANANVDGAITNTITNLTLTGQYIGAGHAVNMFDTATSGGTVGTTVNDVSVGGQFVGGGFAAAESTDASVAGAITTTTATAATAGLKVGTGTAGGSYIGGGYALGKNAVATSSSTVSTTISGAGNTIETDFVGGGKSEGGGTTATDKATADVAGAISNTITNLTLTGQYIGAGHAVNAFDTATSGGTVGTTVNDVSVGGQFIAGGFAETENTDASVAGAITTRTDPAATAGLKVGTSGAAQYVGAGYAAAKAAKATTGGAVTINLAKSTVTGNFIGAGHAKYVAASVTEQANANVTIGKTDIDLATTTITGNFTGAGMADGAFATANVNSGNIEIDQTAVTIIGDYSGAGQAKGADTAATVTGSVTIKISGGTIGTIAGPAPMANKFFGAGVAGATSAGADASVSEHIKIETLGGAVFNNNFYGGGSAGTNPSIASVGKYIKIDLTGATKVNGNFYGGGTSPTQPAVAAEDASVGQYININVDSSDVQNSFYGGGENNDVKGGALSGANAIEILLKNAKITTAPGALVVDASTGDSFTTYQLYGGSRNGSIVKGNVAITAKGTTTIGGDAFAGGNASVASGAAPIAKGNTTVLIEHPSIVKGHLFGGGNSIDKDAANVEGYTTITVSGHVEKDLYGGGNNSKTTKKNGDYSVKIHLMGANAKAGTSLQPFSVYGGARNGEILGSTSILTDGGSIVYGNVYGGGNGLMPNASAVGANGALDVQGRTLENIKGSVHRTVYGGGKGGSNIKDYTTVNITAANKATDVIYQHVYGGGADEHSKIIGRNTGATNAESAEPSFAIKSKENAEGPSAHVTINGTVKWNVYGGSRETDIDYNTIVIMQNGTVEGALHGASYYDAKGSANVKGVTHVEVKKGAVNGAKAADKAGTINPYFIEAAVVGGGVNGSKVLNTAGGIKENRDKLQNYGTTVLINGKDAAGVVSGEGLFIGNDIYGGGYYSKSDANGSHVEGSTLVDMSAGVAAKNIYGGGLQSLVRGYTQVYVGNTVKGVKCKVGSGLSPLPPNSTPVEKTGIIYGGGSGAQAPIFHDRGTNVVIRLSGYVNNVFGGGTDQAIVHGKTGTDVDILGTVEFSVFGGGENKADLAATTDEGAKVRVHHTGLVKQDVFGGGHTAHVLGRDATTVNIYGRIGRNVYGGGFDGNVTQTRGPIVTVTKQQDGVDSGFVGNDVYGGGYGHSIAGETVNTEVNVIRGAVVTHSVFGGGRGIAKNNGAFGKVSGKTKVNISDNPAKLEYTYIGIRDFDKFDESDIWESNEYYRLCRGFYFRGEVEVTREKSDLQDNKDWPEWDKIGQAATEACRWSDTFNTKGFGNVYGGGSWATVGSDTEVNISDMKQKAFNRISGGNMGLKSNNPNRFINFYNLGVGYSAPRTKGQLTYDELLNNEVDNGKGANMYYTDLNFYTTVRVLQDYSLGNSNNTYLTVYYDLMTYDDGINIEGINNGDAKSDLHVRGGVYNAWRPKDHTNVRVEPTIHMHDYAKFRMEANYTIILAGDIISHNNTIAKDHANADDKITLILDIPGNKDLKLERTNHDGTTSKIYGPDNQILKNNKFNYDEILSTIAVTELVDRNTDKVQGVNLHIPPMNVDNGKVDPTNPGGTTKPDLGGNITGGSGGTSGGGSGGGAYGRGAGAGVGNTTSVIAGGSTGYYTDDKSVADHNTVLNKANSALKASGGSGKVIIVNEKKSGQIASSTLREIAKAAAKAGNKVTYQGDTVTKANVIEGRMYIDTSKVTDSKIMIHTGIYTNANMINRTTKIFNKYFSNNFAVISMAHKGHFGFEVRATARPNISKLNKDTLQFYVYSPDTNMFTQIKNPRHFIDANGYVHFYVNYGGDVIITDKPLVRK